MVLIVRARPARYVAKRRRYKMNEKLKKYYKNTNNFDDTLVWLGDAFMRFCKEPNRETEGYWMSQLGAMSLTFPNDPVDIVDDDGSIVRLEVFGEELTEAILHLKGMIKRANELLLMRDD